MARREREKLYAPAGEVLVGADEESLDPLAHYRRKGLFDLAARAGLENVDRQLDQSAASCASRNVVSRNH